MFFPTGKLYPCTIWEVGQNWGARLTEASSWCCVVPDVGREVGQHMGSPGLCDAKKEK